MASQLPDPVRVLVVEDALVERMVLEEKLRSSRDYAFEMNACVTSKEAEQQLAAARWDVICLDLNLPDTEGLETLSRIQAAAHGTPIVVLSHNADIPTALEAIRRGASDFIRKGSVHEEPLQRALLYAIVRHQTAVHGTS